MIRRLKALQMTFIAVSMCCDNENSNEERLSEMNISTKIYLSKQECASSWLLDTTNAEILYWITIHRTTGNRSVLGEKGFGGI